MNDFGISILLVDYSKPHEGKYTFRSIIDQKTSYKYQVILLAFNDYNYEDLLKYKCDNCEVNVIRKVPHDFFNLSACRNYTYGHARYKYVYIIDLGCIFRNNHIQTIVDDLIHDDSIYIVFGSKLYEIGLLEKKDIKLDSTFGNDILYELFENIEYRQNNTYGNYVISSEYFKKIGGYNDTIHAHNDYELDSRSSYLSKYYNYGKIESIGKKYQTIAFKDKHIYGNVSMALNSPKGRIYTNGYRSEKLATVIDSSKFSDKERFDFFNIGPLNTDLDYLESRIYTP